VRKNTFLINLCYRNAIFIQPQGNDEFH